MDPISIGLGVVGLGMQLFGGFGQSGVSKQQAQVSQNIAFQEQQINAQKQQQMQLEARRGQLQNFRNAQRLRANATEAAVNQGAQFGSGLAGGLAGITSQETENVRGINQASQISQNIFGYNNLISQDKQQLASLGGQMATDQGIASLGGSIMKAGPTIGGLAKDFGSSLGSGIFGMANSGGFLFGG